MTATHIVSLLSALVLAAWFVSAVTSRRAARDSDRPASTESDERVADDHLGADGGLR